MLERERDWQLADEREVGVVGERFFFFFSFFGTTSSVFNFLFLFFLVK